MAIVQKTMHQVVILISLNTLQELESLRYQENIAKPYHIIYIISERERNICIDHTQIFFYEILDIGRHLVIKYETH